MNNKKVLILILVGFSFFLNADIFKFKLLNSDKYKLTIKADYRVYLNNKFISFHVNEQSGLLNITGKTDDGFKIEGNVIQYKRSIKQDVNYGFEIQNNAECEFILQQNGKMTLIKNNFFPPLISVPYFPDDNIKTGEVYKCYGEYYIDYQNNYDLVEITAAIKYSGKKNFLNKEYDYFEIYFTYGNLKTNNYFKTAKGHHNLKMYFDNYNGRLVFIEDHFVDELQLKNNDIIKKDGFIDYFYNIIPIMNKDEILKDLTRDIDKKLIEDLDFKKKEEGISITINNLLFKADSIDLLESEYEKLEKIYLMLSKIKDRSFMIIGHTALSGTEEERMKLSTERAKTIALYLINKGFDPKKIFYQGKGAADPVAPNDTEENMKKNRRVEIIILED